MLALFIPAPGGQPFALPGALPSPMRRIRDQLVDRRLALLGVAFRGRPSARSDPVWALGTSIQSRGDLTDAGTGGLLFSGSDLTESFICWQKSVPRLNTALESHRDAGDTPNPVKRSSF